MKRLREWMQRQGWRLVGWLILVPLVTDLIVVGTWERFVAGPLQERGVSLVMQVRSWYVVGAFVLLLARPLSMWNLFGFVTWLWVGVFTRWRSLEDDGEGETEVMRRNPVKDEPMFVILRFWLYLLGVIGLVAGKWLLPVVLAILVVTLSCDVRPRRRKRKRLKRLVTVTE